MPDSFSKGTTIDDSDPQLLRAALEAAFDYRGDVTIRRKSEGDSLEGYIFDRIAGPTLADSRIRVIPSNGGERVTVRCDDIAAVVFSGRDTAEGKSFDTWMKKYVQKKLAGEAANIEAEKLD